MNPTWFMAPCPILSMYYVYALKSVRDGKLYIGYSTDVEKRLHEHNEGKTISTRFRRPFSLLFYEAYINKSDAKRREKYFKSGKGKSSLRMMLRDTLEA